MEIIIVPKYRDMLPPLSSEAMEELRASIKAEGCRDAVILRKSDHALIEGHHRRAICTELGVKFKTEIRDFKTEDEVEAFILRNALARRNMTPSQQQLFRGRLYLLLQETTRPGPHAPHNAAETVAATAGVSEGTVRRDGKLAKAVEALAESLRTSYTNGTLKLTREQVLCLAAKKHDTQLEFARNVRVGRFADWDDALGLNDDSEDLDVEQQEKPAKKAGKKKSGQKAKDQEKAAPEADVATEEDDTEAEPAKEPETLQDRMEAWNTRIETVAKSLAAQIDQIPDGEWIDANRRRIMEDAITSAVATIRQVKSAGPCHTCHGKGCERCRQTGWIPKHMRGQG